LSSSRSTANLRDTGLAALDEHVIDARVDLRHAQADASVAPLASQQS
jgi:hypothetical protein